MRVRRPLSSTVERFFVGACCLLIGAEAHGGDEVVLRVGSSTLSTRDLETRLAELPRTELMALGATNPERIKTFLDRYVVPELLLTQGALKAGILQDPSFRARRDEVLRRMLETALTDEVRPTIGKSDVEQSYAAERQRFDVPAAILIWRILVDDPGVARRILSEASGAGGPERWRGLAREHSLDTATQMRGGTLGFVHADGKTDVPQLEVDPALYAAASKVKDGELVPEPIAEGKHLAVVWRRGSRAARTSTLEAAAPQLTAALLRERVKLKLDALIAALRGQYLRSLNSERIEQISYPPPSFKPRDAFPAVDSAEPSGVLDPPKPGDRGLR